MALIYRGIVKGNTVILPPEAQLNEGSIVEVRLVSEVGGMTMDDQADQRLQHALVAAGILSVITPLGARSSVAERPLLHIAGPPVSETIIAERR